jgi:hypothetical protein
VKRETSVVSNGVKESNLPKPFSWKLSESIRDLDLPSGWSLRIRGL